MGFFNSLRNLKKWFTDKTGITEAKEPTKRKHDDCEIINNKRARMDDSLVEIVEISDESISEAEEVEITEPGPSTMPLRASPPVMLIGGRRNQRRTMSPSSLIDLVETSDEENKKKINHSSYSLSSQPFISSRTSKMVKNVNCKSSLEDKYSFTSAVQECRKSSLTMENDFSALQISNTSAIDDKDQTLAMILKHYVLPKSDATKVLDSSPRSPLSIRRDHTLNQSHSSQTSGKENLEIPGLSLYKNRIIKQEMFYERILRKFRERKEASALEEATKLAEANALAEVTAKKPEDIFQEKLMLLEKNLEKTPMKKDVFPGYSQEIVNEISQQMSGSQHESIIKGKNIKKNDLRTVFSPTAWLNDEVINHYLGMIVDRDPISLHTFDTFFYSKLSSQGYQSVRRWSRKRDIFACKKMFSPIHLGNHWCLICVNFIEKTIKYYDSLGGKNPKCLNNILMYLQEEYKNKKNEDFDSSGWKLMDADDCPKQQNSYDCGVFTCINAEYLARDAKLDFTQDDMPKLRHRVCYEILNNHLCF